MCSVHQSVGVVVVSYNTRRLLHDCLASLRGCALPLCVVVVDNASHDGSAALVRELFPEVALIEAGSNLGFAAATNRGVRHLLEADACPYVLLLNPDTVVQQGALETLLAFLEAHPRVGVVAPRLLNPDGSQQAAAFRFPTVAMTALDVFPPGEVLPGRLYNSWWHGRYPHERADAPFPIDHPLGACMLLRRAVIEQVGLLDDGYFMYAEEVDWCRRIRAAGWAIWQQPAALVTHVGGASTKQVRARMLLALYRSRVRYFKRYESAATLAAHRALIRLGMLRAAWLAWRDLRHGTIDRATWQERMRAYTLIALL